MAESVVCQTFKIQRGCTAQATGKVAGALDTRAQAQLVVNVMKLRWTGNFSNIIYSNTLMPSFKASVYLDSAKAFDKVDHE